MALTKRQVHILKAFENRHADSSLTAYIRQITVYWLLLVAVCSFGFWFSSVKGLPDFAWMFAGMLIGMILRDIGWIRLSRQSFQVLKEFIDWDRIRAVLQTTEEPEESFGLDQAD
jgi:hypothetical protein